MEKMDKKGYFQFVWAGNTKFGVCKCSPQFLILVRVLVFDFFPSRPLPDCETQAEKENLVKLLDKASMNLYRERKKSQIPLSHFFPPKPETHIFCLVTIHRQVN